ncbi:MAG: hypothetical protein QXH80_02865 [Candidatus Nanoarchaeia archaeon]
MRGRPVGSGIRQNIVEILYFMKQGYGYDIYKIYRNIFPPVTLRSIYYHLRKGVELGEFKVQKVKAEKGNYSWGSEAEKIYYELGKNASARGIEKVRKYVDRLKLI